MVDPSPDISTLAEQLSTTVSELRMIQEQLKPMKTQEKNIRKQMSVPLDGIKEWMEMNDEETFVGPNFTIRMKVNKPASKFSIHELESVAVEPDKIESLQSNVNTKRSFTLGKRKPSSTTNKKRKRDGV